jgi:LacI family transcriptional regulator
MTNARTAAARRVRVAVRLFDWSAWGRQVIQGVQRFAHERGDWQVYVDVGPAGNGRVLNHATSWDGIITSVLQKANATAYRRLLRTGATPVVAISASIPNVLASIPAVRVDDVKIAKLIGGHLRDAGFRRLAFFGTRPLGTANHRVGSILEYAAGQGLPCELYNGNGSTPQSAQAAVVRWVRRLAKPVGIVAWNMDVARRIVDACRTAGVQVPSEVAVVAWDDDPMLAETLEPTISAAVLPAERLGHEAAQLLANLMAGRPAPARPLRVVPAGVLHVRQSSDVSTLADRDVHLAVQYIRERGTEPLRVDQVADAVRVSRRKLEQDFKRLTGRTLHAAILQVRLERAKQLLVETGWTLARVAERSGLGTAKTLHQVFRSLEGMTPAEYRGRFGVR